MCTRIHTMFALGCMLALGSFVSRAYAEEDRKQQPVEEYRIGAGDVLQISVWKEPDVSTPRVVVRSDGKIALPLVKEIDVLGLTAPEVERTITGRLTKLIPAAEVTVAVISTNSKKIYLI